MTTWFHEQRLEAVHAAIRQSGASTVIDLGCGDGDLFARLVTEAQIERIVGIDLSLDALRRLRVRLDMLEEKAVAQVDLVHGSMTESGSGLNGFDCATLIEAIEHVEPAQRSALERSGTGDALASR